MGLHAPYAHAAPSDDQIGRLTERLVDLSERMADHQILEVADALHDRLRERRILRGHSLRRLNARPRPGGLNVVV